MNPITDGVVGAVSSVVDNIIQRVWPDPVEQAKAQLAFAQLKQSGELAALTADVTIATNQSTTNTEEAKSTNMFIAGWRPFVGWVCGGGFAIQVLGPLLTWGSTLAGHKVEFPPLDFSIMGPTLLGMLGLGGFRTYEKVKGVEGSR